MKPIAWCLLALLCAACTTPPEPWWPNQKVAGPPVAGDGQRAVVLHRCTQRPWAERAWGSSGSSLCETAYRLGSGKLVELEALAASIDGYLGALPEYARWPIEAFPVDGFQQLPRPPYWLTLLSLEPTIVLLVPRASQGNPSYGCDHPLQGSRCVWSRVGRGGVRYDAEVRPASGLKWFAPGHTQGLVDLQLQAGRYVFPIDGVRAQVDLVGDHLRFTRSR